MLHSIENREVLEKLQELASLKNQVHELRSPDKLGKQQFQENTKKLFEPLTDTKKNTSENLTKTITETSFKNKKALEKLNEIVLEIMNNWGILAVYLLSPLSKISNPKNSSERYQLK